MSPLDWTLFIADMQEACDKIADYTRAPRKITGCDLGSAIPGRQGHESHGTGTHAFEFFVVPTRGIDFSAFCADTRTVDAVVRNLQIIGEAAKGIPDDQKLLRPEIDWRAIKGLRNRIVHEYFGLSLSVIWAIVQSDLPKLAALLREWPGES